MSRTGRAEGFVELELVRSALKRVTVECERIRDARYVFKFLFEDEAKQAALRIALMPGEEIAQHFGGLTMRKWSEAANPFDSSNAVINGFPSWEDAEIDMAVKALKPSAVGVRSGRI
jgi:hypothetical protein